LPLGLRVVLLAYSIAIEAVVWFAIAPVLWLQSVFTRAGHAELRQRLAWDAPPAVAPTSLAPRPVLIHAVSAGEMNAAAPLASALAGHAGGIMLSTGTAAGLATARRLQREHPAIAGALYLPWDRRAIRRWLRALAPAAIVVVETEIWPNLFTACRELGIPLFIANGRIRPRDRWKYRLGRWFFRDVLESAAWIGVQTDSEREAFIDIGAPPARVQVAGNLKFDAALASVAESPVLTPASDSRPLVVAGSTHHPEERWLLECAQLMAGDGVRVRLVVAPRDTVRAGAVARLARAHGLRPLTWSEWSANKAAAWDVLILDQYGPLRACYAGADVVVMGGTFVQVGGHNLLEAAAAAKPILVGPYVSEISALVEPFARAGAVMQLSGADPARSLADACRTLFADPEQARRMGEAAREACRTGAGSADRHARVILERLAPAR
jgi:3-deoxy-D-manno-octulosonic-acid transferase